MPSMRILLAVFCFSCLMALYLAILTILQSLLTIPLAHENFNALNKSNGDEIEINKHVFWQQMKNNVNITSISIKNLIRGHVKESLTRLLTSLSSELIFPHPEIDGQFSLGHFNTCAVVSSAFELTQAEHGSHIDDNDFILRVNNAKVSGFEKHVGTRTDGRLINNKVVEMLHKQNGSLLFANGEKLLSYSYCRNLRDTPDNCERRDKTRLRAAEFNAKMHEQFLYMMPPDSFLKISNFIKDVKAVKEGSLYPTTGFIAILLAMMHCTTVHAYGFIPIHNEKHCYYYSTFEPPCGLTDYHARVIEKLILLSLAEPNERLIFKQGILRLNASLLKR